uniref:F-actin monooxygenase n=1 Tax=Trichuris muris TaxID=70415 RepID=A0A5S6QFD2_TRIMR
MDSRNTCVSTVFESFVAASTFKGILTSFSQLCCLCDLDLSDHFHFYYRLRNSITSWKAKCLWDLLDKRMAQAEYAQQSAGRQLKVLVVGAGPCGLRMAIECALLGCRVIVVEKRTKFSRNNVLHIWPFVIEDLRSLGAKLLYPKFCAGSIDHISIHQLQCILLKVALLLGVEVCEAVSFVKLHEPHVNDFGVGLGWTAVLSPPDHYLRNYEFSVLISADGKRNTLPGFRRIEFRGKLAIAITANFINSHTEAEERVPEISGTSFIFRQRFFREMREATGIDLENIVYYKDETHYFVMTAKKQSLLDKGVILKDFEDISMLLSPDNVCHGSLMGYAREAADFACEHALPRLDFALNDRGQPDIAMFDFTSLYSAENSCRFLQRRTYPLLLGIVGDSLHEPFWPTGSGCARGFLGVFDSAWMIRNYGLGKMSILEILAERESVYKLLAQSTPETLHKNLKGYTIDPRTRYPSVECTLQPSQVESLFDTDMCRAGNGFVRLHNEGTLNRSFESHQALVRWLHLCLAPYRLRVESVTASFCHGPLLAALLHRYRPDYASELFNTRTMEWKCDLDYCMSSIQTLWGIPPPRSFDNSDIFSYLSRLFAVLSCRALPPATTFLVPSAKNKDGKKIKRPIAEDDKSVESDAAVIERHRLRLKRLIESGDGDDSVSDNDAAALESCKKVEKLKAERLAEVDLLLRGKLPLSKAPKKPPIIIRKLNPDEVKDMEEKLKKTAMGCLLYKRQEPALSSKEAKIIALKTACLKEKAAVGFQQSSNRFHTFDLTMEKLEKRLRRPDTSGAVGVSQLRQMHSTSIGMMKCNAKPPVPVPGAHPSAVNTESFGETAVSGEYSKLYCHVCHREVYLTERVNIENVSCHRDCFRCAFCNCILRLNGYGSEYIEKYGRMFFCSRHLNCSLREKLARIEYLSPKEITAATDGLLEYVDDADKRDSIDWTNEKVDFFSPSSKPFQLEMSHSTISGDFDERVEFILASSPEQDDSGGSRQSWENLYASQPKL